MLLLCKSYQINPILNGGGGGKFTLSAIYRLKSPESGDKGGVMGYQNSSWDICDPIKKVSGPKIFSGPIPGPAKFGRQKRRLAFMGYLKSYHAHP